MDCAECGTPFEPRRNGGKPQRFCSAPCRKRMSVRAVKERDPDYYRRWYRENADRWDAYDATRRAKPETEEQRRESVRKWARTHPEEESAYRKAWFKANPDKMRRYARERQARERGAVVELFDESEIFERDGWVCQWCHEPVDPNLKGRHPMMKSLDHIKPLIKGGEHSRANTQLVHLRCNSSKGAREYT